jgi:hypothetical protein
VIRLEAFVEDNKIAKVLYALDGLVMRVEVHPVRNVTVENGKLAEAGNPTNGPEVLKYCIKRALTEGRKTFSLKEARAVAEQFGVTYRSVQSATHPFAHKLKMMRAIGHGQYSILVKLPATKED